MRGIQVCYFDDELGQWVHVFRGARRKCLCGKVKVESPRRRYGNPFVGRKKDKPEGYEFQNLDGGNSHDAGDFEQRMQAAESDGLL